MERLNRKGQNALLVLIVIGIFIVVIFFVLPSFLNGGSNQYSGPLSQGVVVSAVDIPSSVAPDSTFVATFSISNNLNGNNANNVLFCLDDLGLVANTSNTCLSILSLASGATLPEKFFLRAPSSSQYGNIPYAQYIGYYLTFSYATGAKQSVEFASSSSNNYPTPSMASSGQTAGPLEISSTTQSQPVLYGGGGQLADGQLTISLNDIGSGIVLGNATVYITIEKTITQFVNVPAEFKLVNSTALAETYSINQTVGANTAQLPALTFTLNNTEYNYLTSNSIPYVSSQIQMYVHYTYEEDGFYPVYFQTQS